MYKFALIPFDIQLVGCEFPKMEHPALIVRQSVYIIQHVRMSVKGQVPYRKEKGISHRLTHKAIAGASTSQQVLHAACYFFSLKRSTMLEDTYLRS